MKFYLNQIFRSTTGVAENIKKDENGYFYYRYATSKNNKSSANIARPMFWYKDVNLADNSLVCPAFICHSNPLQKDESINPWRDVIIQNEGIVYYNGDNMTAGVAPNYVGRGKPATGNKKLESLMELYFSKNIEDRKKAPPILVFEQVKVGVKTKGYRQFIGLGIISNCDVRQQYDGDGKVFSNYLFEITLISLDHGQFDFDWINDRRNNELSLSEINNKAPNKWRKWIKDGTSSILNVRQKILRLSASQPVEQINELKKKHKDILEQIVHHYSKRSKKDKFEALASLATKEFFGKRYSQGWITQSTGDMGVDFVGRYDIIHQEIDALPGNILGRTSLLVLGQAKCRTRFDDKHKGELTRDISRISSRLTRGTIGVYVTTGTFKGSTQTEVYIDKLPIILINGRLLSDLILRFLLITGKSMKKVLNECDDWYDNNQKNIPPSNILQDDIFS